MELGRFEDPLSAELVCVELPVEVCHYLHALGTCLLQGDLLFPLGALSCPVSPDSQECSQLVWFKQVGLGTLGVFKTVKGSATALRQVCGK